MWAACFLDLSGQHIFIYAKSGTFSIFNHLFFHCCISSSVELWSFLFVLHLSRILRSCFSFDFHIHVFCFSLKTHTVLYYTVQLGPYLFKYRFSGYFICVCITCHSPGPISPLIHLPFIHSSGQAISQHRQLSLVTYTILCL